MHCPAPSGLMAPPNARGAPRWRGQIDCPLLLFRAQTVGTPLECLLGRICAHSLEWHGILRAEDEAELSYWLPPRAEHSWHSARMLGTTSSPLPVSTCARICCPGVPIETSTEYEPRSPASLAYLVAGIVNTPAP
jgi:hypothetical protein